MDQALGHLTKYPPETLDHRTLEILVGELEQEIEFHVEALRCLPPDDPDAPEWQRDVEVRQAMLVRVQQAMGAK